MKQIIAFLLALFVSSPVWSGGDSSDGHIHAEQVAISGVQSTPRATAATEEFEVVAVLEERQLVVYVDRFASNEPVTKAKVEIDAAGTRGLAKETEPGTYVLQLASPLLATRHMLTITIEAGENMDLLTTVLDTSHLATASEAGNGRKQWLIWGMGLAFALATVAVGTWFFGRRKGGRRAASI